MNTINLVHCIIFDLEPAIVAHVKLKDKLTLGKGKESDVTRKVEASIERTAQIEKVSHT